MEIVKRMIIRLNDSDIMDEHKDGSKKHLSQYHFEGLNSDIFNKAWFVEYSGKFGYQVLKNKCTTEAGAGYFIDL